MTVLMIMTVMKVKMMVKRRMIMIMYLSLTMVAGVWAPS